MVTLLQSALGSVSGVNVTYTSQTVVIDPATVAQELISISDGGIFTFKSAAGALAKLASGKVMYLQGKAVAIVSNVAKNGGHLVVQTTQPTITDFIKSGTIDVSAPITFAGGSVSQDQVAQATVSDASNASPSSNQAPPNIDAAVLAQTLRPPATAAPALPETKLVDDKLMSGNTGPIGYMVNLSRATNKLDFSVNYKYDKSGFLVYIQSSGYVDTFKAHLQMVIVNDLTKSSRFIARPLDGKLHIQWSLARGPDAKETISVPAFTLPISFNFPFLIGGFPFFVKVQFQAKFIAALTARNSTMEGGVDVEYLGTGGGLSAGSSSFTPQGSETAQGTFLTNQNSSLRSFTPIASGATIAVVAPKISFGIGFPSFSGSSFIDLISSMGQTTGAVIAGQSCAQYELDFTVAVGLGLEFLKVAAALPLKDLYTKAVHFNQPGCGG
jgi:hypothetical protein